MLFSNVPVIHMPPITYSVCYTITIILCLLKVQLVATDCTANINLGRCSYSKLCNNHIPVAEITANLHPLRNPGSMPSMDFPRTGGVSSSCFRLDANTATEAFSAFFVNSDLATMNNVQTASEPNSPSTRLTL